VIERGPRRLRQSRFDVDRPSRGYTASDTTDSDVVTSESDSGRHRGAVRVRNTASSKRRSGDRELLGCAGGGDDGDLGAVRRAHEAVFDLPVAGLLEHPVGLLGAVEQHDRVGDLL